jgi:hypothetical protein
MVKIISERNGSMLAIMKMASKKYGENKAIMANNKYHRNENESSASANGENNGGIGSNGISGESIEIIIKL